MAVVTQTQENQVKPRPPWRSTRELLANRLFITTSSQIRLSSFTYDTKNLPGRDAERLKQGVMSKFEIALGMVRRHAPFIAEIKFHVRPLQAIGTVGADQPPIQFSRCGATRQRDSKWVVLRLSRRLDKEVCHFTCEFFIIFG